MTLESIERSARTWRLDTSRTLNADISDLVLPVPARNRYTRNRLVEQLGEIGTRIDHRLAQGRLSADYANRARRKVDDLQAEISDKQRRNGGQLTQGDRFAIQEQIHQLVEEIDRNSGPAPPR